MLPLASLDQETLRLLLSGLNELTGQTRLLAQVSQSLLALALALAPSPSPSPSPSPNPNPNPNPSPNPTPNPQPRSWPT